MVFFLSPGRFFSLSSFLLSFFISFRSSFLFFFIIIILFIFFIRSLVYIRSMGSIVGRIAEETPKYELVRQGPGYEVRKYGANIAACVAATPAAGETERQFSNRAFRTLAAYIGVFTTPQNQAQQAVAMTAPVHMTPASTGRSMAFILPR